jgi:hypothetical protein
MQSPIFISGLRKSGTSMVKNLLDDHPGLFVFPPNELHFFKYSCHPSIVKDKASYIDNPRELALKIAQNKFITRITEKDSEFYIPEFSYETFFESIENSDITGYPQVYEVLFKSFYEALGKGKEAERLRFVSKTVLETEFFPELVRWFPDLKFVYVLRNPYAHFVSAIKSLRTHTSRKKSETYEGMKLSSLRNPYPYLGPEIFRMKHSYYFMEKFERLYPKNFYVLVYDDLLKNSEAELEKLASFLDIEFKSTLQTPSIMGKIWKGNSWKNYEFRGIDQAPLEEWKQDISGGEVKLINKFFGNLIKKYFKLEKSGANILKPLHPSEYRPKIYLANRLLYFSNSF